MPFGTRKGTVTITGEFFSFNKVLENMLGAWRNVLIIRALFLLISQIGCDYYLTVIIVKINTAVRQTLQFTGGIRQSNRYAEHI